MASLKPLTGLVVIDEVQRSEAAIMVSFAVSSAPVVPVSEEAPEVVDYCQLLRGQIPQALVDVADREGWHGSPPGLGSGSFRHGAFARGAEDALRRDTSGAGAFFSATLGLVHGAPPLPRHHRVALGVEDGVAGEVDVEVGPVEMVGAGFFDSQHGGDRSVAEPGEVLEGEE